MNKEKAIRKIQLLNQVDTNNGSTPGEVMVAKTKIQELMAKYDITSEEANQPNTYIPGLEWTNNIDPHHPVYKAFMKYRDIRNSLYPEKQTELDSYFEKLIRNKPKSHPYVPLNTRDTIESFIILLISTILFCIGFDFIIQLVVPTYTGTNVFMKIILMFGLYYIAKQLVKIIMFTGSIGVVISVIGLL